MFAGVGSEGRRHGGGRHVGGGDVVAAGGGVSKPGVGCCRIERERGVGRHQECGAGSGGVC